MASVESGAACKSQRSSRRRSPSALRRRQPSDSRRRAASREGVADAPASPAQSIVGRQRGGVRLNAEPPQIFPLIYARPHIRLQVGVYFMWLPFVRACVRVCVTEGTLSNGEPSVLWSEGALIPINSVPSAHRETHSSTDTQTCTKKHKPSWNILDPLDTTTKPC